MNTIVIPLGEARYEFHPFSDIWPLIEGEDYDKLALDIVANGLRLPILLYKGRILDGRNRYLACKEAGVVPRFEEADAKTDDEALRLVVSMNERRRHLSYEQRAFAGARLANMKEGAPKGNKRAAKTTSSKELVVSDDHRYHHHSTSILEASKIMDVTPAAIKRAKAVIEHGDKELEKAVVKRKVKLSNACEQVRPKRKPVLAGQKRSAARPTIERVPVIDTSKRRLLTPEQVDPEFKGTAIDFARKYGHVQVETAQERATNRFAEWSMHINKWAREYKQWPLSEIDLNWLRTPRQKDVDRFLDAYATLALVLDNIQEIHRAVKDLKKREK